MAAPTPEEIRLAVWKAWNVSDGPEHGPLVYALEELLGFELYCRTNRRLYHVPDHGLRDRKDEIVDEVVAEVLPQVERMLMDAAVQIFERYALEKPRARRASRAEATA